MKKFFSIICSILVFLTVTICASAESDLISDNENSLDGYFDLINEEIDGAIDSDTKKSMQENNFNNSDISDKSIFDVFSVFIKEITNNLTEPLRVLSSLAAVLILCSLAKSLACENQGISKAYITVSIIGCITVIYQMVYNAFEDVCLFLDNLSEFMYAYVPIYASVTAASGGLSTGGSYYASAFGICELIAFVSQKVIMPFLSVFLALTFTSSINTDMKFSSAAESIKNAVQFILKGIMMIFTGMITIQSFSSSAADTAAGRAVKFGASNFIPIIGGSVSEAYSTVYSSIGIIRASIGTIGISAVMFMILKPLAEIICIKIVLCISKIISDLLGISEASELLKSTNFAMSAAVSAVLCFGMMFIISTAIIMMTAANISL